MISKFEGGLHGHKTIQAEGFMAAQNMITKRYDEEFPDIIDVICWV